MQFYPPDSSIFTPQDMVHSSDLPRLSMSGLSSVTIADENTGKIRFSSTDYNISIEFKLSFVALSSNSDLSFTFDNVVDLDTGTPRFLPNQTSLAVTGDSQETDFAFGRSLNVTVDGLPSMEGVPGAGAIMVFVGNNEVLTISDSASLYALITVHSQNGAIYTYPGNSLYQAEVFGWKSVTFPTNFLPNGPNPDDEPSMILLLRPQGEIHSEIGTTELEGVEKVWIQGSFETVTLSSSVTPELSLTGWATTIQVDGREVSRPTFVSDLAANEGTLIALFGSIGLSGVAVRVWKTLIPKPYLKIENGFLRRDKQGDFACFTVMNEALARSRDATRLVYSFALYADQSNEMVDSQSKTTEILPSETWEQHEFKINRTLDQEKVYNLRVIVSCAEGVELLKTFAHVNWRT